MDRNFRHPVTSRQFRALFFLVFGLVIVLLLFLRLWILPRNATMIVFDPNQPAGKAQVSVVGDRTPTEEVVTQAVDATLGGALASVLLGSLLFFFRPTDEEKREQGAFVEPGDIEQHIQQAASGADFWYVKARTARYFSTKTLQWLMASADNRNRDIGIRLHMMNPLDGNLLGQYVDYRISGGAGSELTAQGVQDEIFATVIRCLIAMKKCPRLAVEIVLSDTLWTARLDISQDMALITGPGKIPAIMLRKKSPLYSVYRHEFRTSFSAHDRIKLLLTDIVLPREFRTSENIRQALLSVQVAHEVAQDQLDRVVRLVGA